MKTSSVLLTALMLSGLVFSGFVFQTGLVSADTSSAITSNITRTSANSPWVFTEDVVVSQGATLTIEPGVMVNLKEHSLKVDGTLVAVSVFFEGWGPITFSETSTAWNKQTNSGSVIANSTIHASLVILGSLLIYGCTISAGQGRVALSVSGGAPLILNNDIKCGFEAHTAVSVSGSNVVISGNKVTGYRDNGLMFLTGMDSPHMARFGAGDAITVSGGSAYISDNTLANGAAAVDVQAGTVTIERNLFDTNVFGAISVGSSAKVTVRSNTFTDQSGGISGVTSNAVITNNNFYNTYGADVTLSQSGIDLTNNWWETTNTTEIATRKIAGGTANFQPFLTAPNPQATPIITPINVPTPTVQPEVVATLDLACRESASGSNFNFEIFGALAAGQTAIADALIQLSLSVDGGQSWNQLTVVKTDSNGNFKAGWAPQATGDYLIKADWEGNLAYSPVSATISALVMQSGASSSFSLATNSTFSSNPSPSGSEPSTQNPATLSVEQIMIIGLSVTVVSLAVIVVIMLKKKK